MFFIIFQGQKIFKVLHQKSRYIRISHRRCSVRKVISISCNFIEKETLTQMFSCNFCKTSNNTFLGNTSGRLLLTYFLPSEERSFFNINHRIQTTLHRLVISSSAYRYPHVRKSCNPVVLLSVSIVLRVVSKVLLTYFSGFQSYKPLVLPNSRTINTMAKTSVLYILLYVGLLIHLLRPVYCQSYFLQDY